MFDYRKMVWRYERILKKEFSRKCPVCGKEMESGYLAGLLTKWAQKGLKRHPSGDTTLMRFNRYIWPWRIGSLMPGYNCLDCGLIIAKYNLHHKYNPITRRKITKKLEDCPYCFKKLKAGRIYSARGTWWLERIGKWGNFKGRKMMIEPLSFWRIVGIPARLCDDCGIVLCKYEDQTWRNRVILAVFFASVIFTLLVILFIFGQ